ncbi:hypothetical protein D3C76_790200 [compost metagenome]
MEFTVDRGEWQFHFVQLPVTRGVAQRRVVGDLHHDILLGFYQGMQRHVEARFDTRQEHNLLGLDAPRILVPQVGHDGGTQIVLGHAVTQHRMFQALVQRVDDHGRGGEVHIGDPHRQHIGRVAAPFGTAGAVALQYRVEIESHGGSISQS